MEMGRLSTNIKYHIYKPQILKIMECKGLIRHLCRLNIMVIYTIAELCRLKDFFVLFPLGFCVFQCDFQLFTSLFGRCFIHVVQ